MIANISNIDYNTSIQKRKLIYKKDFTGVVKFLMLPITGMLLIISLSFYQFDSSNQNDRAFKYAIFPPLFAFCVFLIVRKLNEDKLICIRTNLSKSRNKELLLQFLNSENYIPNSYNEQIIFLLEDDVPSLTNHRICVTIFLISDNEIFFNMGKRYAEENWPIMIDHLFMKRDLDNFFKDKLK